MHPILARYRTELEKEGLPSESLYLEEVSGAYTQVQIFVASRHDYHRLCRVVDAVSREQPHQLPGDIHMRSTYRGGSVVWFGEDGFFIGFAARQQAQNFCLYAREFVLPITGLLNYAWKQGISPSD